MRLVGEEYRYWDAGFAMFLSAQAARQLFFGARWWRVGEGVEPEGASEYKIGSNCCKSNCKAKYDRSFVRQVDGWSPRMTPVVRKAIYNCLGRFLRRSSLWYPRRIFNSLIWVRRLRSAIARELFIHGRCDAAGFCWIRPYRRNKRQCVAIQC